MTAQGMLSKYQKQHGQNASTGQTTGYFDTVRKA